MTTGTGPPAVYERLAGDYHWLLPDGALTGENFLTAHAGLLASLPPDAAVLDCACGIGVLALALARRGHRVSASDGSAGMAAEARRRAAEAGVGLSVDVRPWDRLSEDPRGPYDLVLCTGNSLVHAEGEDAMLAALTGMRAALRPGGRLLVDARNWERIRARRVRVGLPATVTERDGARGIPLYLWSIPDSWHAPHVAEIVVMIERDGRLEHRRHTFAFRPVPVGELVRRVHRAGFTDVACTWRPHAEGYAITARRPRGPTSSGWPQ